jgi:hypothetical protein
LITEDQNGMLIPEINVGNIGNNGLDVPFVLQPDAANADISASRSKIGYASAFLRLNKNDPYLQNARSITYDIVLDPDVTMSASCTLHAVDIRFDQATNEVHNVVDKAFKDIRLSNNLSNHVYEYSDYNGEEFKMYDHIFHIGGEIRNGSRTSQLTAAQIRSAKLMIYFSMH